MPCVCMAIRLNERGAPICPRNSVIRAQGNPLRRPPAASASTTSPGSAPCESAAETSYSWRSLRSVGLSRAAPANHLVDPEDLAPGGAQ